MRERIVTTASQFVGWVRETTRANDGPWVEAIQRLTGSARYSPWCASFVTMVLDIAFAGKNPLRRTASCDEMLNDARVRGLLVDAPTAGDVFFVMRTPTDAIHTGLVVSPVRDGQVDTIEGNTNTDGSREGWGVFARSRSARNLVFVRCPDAS